MRRPPARPGARPATAPPNRPRHHRSVVAVLGALLVALMAGAAPATATGTDTGGYRFWGYYQQSGGSWAFAETGADATEPADGSVEGWRFAASAMEDTRYPRATPTFDDVCAGIDPEDDAKRVAVVLDFGRAADGADGAEPPAPRAACAVVPVSATGNDVLAAVAETRAEGGMTCGVDGYPATGCGEAVNALSAQAQAPDEDVELALPGSDDAASDTGADATGDDGSGAGTWIVVAVVAVVVVLGALALLRRRGSQG